MPRTIVCTAGTTIATGCPSLEPAKREGADWGAPQLDLDAQIRQRVSGFNLKNLAAPTNLSAEINSLLLLGCCPDDEVVLLAGDDAAGWVCATHLAEAIRACFSLPKARCKIVRIPHLQTRDPLRFRREGIPRLIQEVLTYVRDPQRRYGGGVVLNPTGGFKGAVPFLAILGMLYGARVAYGSRASDRLVELPPQPITHDASILTAASEAIAWAKRQGVFRSEEFLAKIPGGTAGVLRERCSGLLEIESDGEATLSPIATVLAEKAADESGRVFISPAAAEKLRTMSGPPKTAAMAWLLRAASADWRKGNGHHFAGSDLEVYGEKRKPIRIAGISRGKDFFLCMFYFQDHNLYDRDLCNYQRSDFTDLDSFLPLVSDSFGPEEARESWGDLLAGREILRGENERLEARVVELGADLGRVQNRLGETRKAIKTRQKELASRIKELEATVRELGKKLEEATKEAESDTV